MYGPLTLPPSDPGYPYSSTLLTWTPPASLDSQGRFRVCYAGCRRLDAALFPFGGFLFVPPFICLCTLVNYTGPVVTEISGHYGR